MAATSPAAGILEHDRRAVEIAVIVPLFRHSVFVADAVVSALEQGTARPYRIVIVNDGCPHAESHRVALSLAGAWPHRIDYIRQTNKGLSASRNTGVEYALQRWPSVRAFYFLDADNRIEPGALDRAYAALLGDPKLGWAYPDIAMFGEVSHYFDYSGAYSVLNHLVANTSEAGSMVRREVFDAGCRFDEKMRQGYEDWEFWWQATEAGFEGRHVPYFGLRYRKRPESMLSEAKREHETLALYMRGRHKGLFSPKSLVAREAKEAPRFAVLDGVGKVDICTDVRRTTEQIDEDELIARISAARHHPHANWAPRLVVASSRGALACLSRLKLDRWVLWWLENELLFGGETQAACVEIAPASPAASIAVHRLDHTRWAAGADRRHLMAVRRSILNDSFKDEVEEKIASLKSGAPVLKTATLRVEIPGAAADAAGLASVHDRYLEFVGRLHAAVRHDDHRFPAVKRRSVPTRPSAGDVPPRVLECGALFPLHDQNRRDVAFVLPLVAFGGVERVALSMACEFRRRGWSPHLTVLAERAAVSDEWLAAFDSVSFCHEPDMYRWSDVQQYMGTTYPKWTTAGDSRSLEGLLLTMDAVIGFHAAALHRVLGKLRRAGVATAASLHIQDMSLFGREVGHPFLAMGYEHAYDLLVPCSSRLMAWCHAMGVPQDKLVEVPNAPAYDLDRPSIERILSERFSRGAGEGDLRVLFLGRLDRQKGIGRLFSIIRRTRAQKLPVVWRIVGSSLMPGEDSAVIPPDMSDLIEPPVYGSDALTRLYAWSDVLILPSHWEGLPLTILEAARLGVMPLATRVGAVEEAVEDGSTGILIDDAPDPQFAEEAVGALARLAADRAELARLSAAAAGGMTRSWQRACSEFIARLEALVGARGQNRSL
jgi:glycosyltransferase involved in cell wall biosynthesis